MKKFTVIFSKECTNEKVGTFMFTKIQRKSEADALTGIKGTSETYFFFGNKLHQEGAELELDPNDYHIKEKEYTPEGEDKVLTLKYLTAKK